MSRPLPPIPAHARRKIERLEARIAELEARIDRDFAVYRENLYESVDAKTRIEQAIRILQGGGDE
jgi:BMFP domain-containing protein YqiC